MPCNAASKGAFVLVVVGYPMTRGVPRMWLPMAFTDFCLLVLFLLAWREGET